MKIKSFTGLTEIDGLRVNKPVVGIVVAADTALDKETIEIKRVSGRDGSIVNITPRVEIVDLAEICAEQVGFAKISAADSLVFIKVANGGLKLDNDQYLEIELGTLTSEKAYKVYGLEDNQIVDACHVYNRFTIPQGEELKKYVIGDKELLAIPANGLISLKAFCEDGVTNEYGVDELKAMSQIENDLVKVGATVKYGYDKFFCVSVEDVKEIEIECTEDVYQFFMLSNQ